MTDTDDDAEVEDERPVLIGDGEVFVLDPDYLDPAIEAQGVLAIQYSLERGLWSLIGRGGDGEPYTQTWEAAGVEFKAGKRSLRPVN